MKILHITNSSNGYEEVNLIANRISKNNSFSLIERDGQEFMTGGFLINDTPEIRKVLDSIPVEEQWHFVKSFKMDPWKKAYLKD